VTVVTRKNLICYAIGQNSSWQAYCLDLDLAVQGRSFEEVCKTLNLAIQDYVEAALQEDITTRNRPLNRRGPLLERLDFFWKYAAVILTPNSAETRHGFTVACPV
jgi:hypothetical protein